MRVLQLIDSLDAGGAERMAVNLANALTSSVERSYLCATRAEGLLKQGLVAEVGYLYLNRRSTLDLAALQRLVCFVQQEQIGIIHAHASSFFIATLLKLRVPKLRLIWHDHYGNSEFLDQRPKRMLRWCSRFFSAVIAVNAGLATWNSEVLKCSTITFLPNFVVPYQSKAVTALAGSTGKRILCLANLRPQKDHATLFKACQLVFASYPDWSLHCVGRESDDEYTKQLKDMVTGLGLETPVWFYGSCPDTGSIIAQCDIGVLASASEGLPLALLEYGQGGLAVVATAVGDCERVITSAAYGSLVPAGDPEALAAALSQYISDSTARQTVAKALNGYVSTHYAQESVVSKLLSIYNT
ncbi:glycosyltransferase [Formosa algae]|uniref:Glycosyltransferase involved in cell wall biosynthesis n=1 Tax=Formosa algae TaxID=225843 RepID=A0A9X0YQ58_9FLAO|nr:glycosyltransferase [Formosa algae]MBP1841332.1 glycosyltransferase involved in cell wall biosynthesis [Formosa algae]MDQ0336746.1 glycosyltransferase involved in cell wall biosynthesis [Formosa algae]OEI79860.1 glycosyltransferase [Formosa algae]